MLLLVRAKRIIVAAVLPFFIITGGWFAAPPAAEAKSIGQILGESIAEWLLVKEYFKYYHNQKYDVLAGMKNRDGVNTDGRANELLSGVSNRIMTSVNKRERVDGPAYTFFVNNHADFNAYCNLGHNITVNAGAVQFVNYNEDEIAVVVAHEVGHGQRNHSLNQLDKLLPVTLVHRLYLSKNQNDLSQILSYLVYNRIVAKGATLPGEWEADALSFDWSVDAGYNPGAGAALWSRVADKYGSGQRNFFGEILQPSDHPTQPQRVEYFSSRLTQYSGGKVKVFKNNIFLNGQPVFMAAKANGEIPVERAFLVAGRLALALKAPGPLTAAEGNDSGVIMMGRQIVVPAEGEGTAQDIADSINKVLGLQAESPKENEPPAGDPLSS